MISINKLLTIGFVLCMSVVAVKLTAQGTESFDIGTATFEEIQAWVLAGATFLIGRLSVFIPKIETMNRTWVVFVGGVLAIVLFTVFQGFDFATFLGQLKTVAATMASFDLFKNLKLPSWLMHILGIKLEKTSTGLRATTDPAVQ